MKPAAALIGMALSACVCAATPEDFAQRWQVIGTQADNAYAVPLDESVYRAVKRQDLSDLAAFNAAGDQLPFGPAPAGIAAAPAAWRAAKAFRVPIQAGMSESQVRMQIAQGVKGGMRLDADISRSTGAPAMDEWIIEARHPGQATEALQVEVAGQSADFTAQVSVEGGDDLQQWRPLASAVLVSLQQEGRRLQKLTIGLPDGGADYLRVRVSNPPPALEITGYRLKQRPVSPLGVPAMHWITADLVKQDGRAYIYRLPAWIAHEQLDVDINGTDLAARFDIASKRDEDDAWRHEAVLTAFQLRAGGVALHNDPVTARSGRMRHWRIASDTVLTAAPVLKIGYRPERFLLLTHGKPPYTVAAGSLAAKRNSYPLQVLFSEVQRRQGSSWRPASVRLGPPLHSAAAVGAGRLPEDWKKSLLWLVLALGAGGVMLMVLSLLKKPAA
ncbi:MAG TPA: DUF3999 family protein [Arenimonas sp.]|nr:DUF3999 family protein [Arenimonas sp.]